MKKTISLIFGALLFCISTALQAQTYKIDTAKVTFETRSRDCLLSSVDPKAKELKKALKKYLNKTFQIKMKGVGFLTNKDVLKAQDVMCGTISAKRMNVYAHIVQMPTVSEISLFGSFGYDIFIDPKIYSKEFGEMKNIMNAFLLQYLNEYYAREVGKTSKNVKRLNNKRTSLAKRIDKNERKSSRAERKIAKLTNKKAKDSKEEIANTAKSNDLTNKKTNLANDNQKAAVKILLIDDKLPKLNAHLKELMAKQKDLSKVAL